MRNYMAVLGSNIMIRPKLANLPDMKLLYKALIRFRQRQQQTEKPWSWKQDLSDNYTQYNHCENEEHTFGW